MTFISRHSDITVVLDRLILAPLVRRIPSSAGLTLAFLLLLLRLRKARSTW